MVIIGGMGNVWGAIAGAFVIEGLNFWLLPSLTKWGQAMGLDVDFSSWNMLIFGVLLVVMMLYRPQGFIPSKSRKLVFADDGHAYPAGMQGPEGDAAHQMHPALEVGHEAHATPQQVAIAPQHEPQSLAAPAAPVHAPAAMVEHQPHAPVADQQPPPRRSRFSRFEPGSNPFDRVRDSGAEGAPA
jgi:hypothetical protein